MKCLECDYETEYNDAFSTHVVAHRAGHASCVGRDETISQVREFHRAMGQPYDEKPGVSPSPTSYPVEEAFLDSVVTKMQGHVTNIKDLNVGDSVRLLRARLMIEELAEVLDAMIDGDIDDVLKELCDLQYVLDGTFLAFGLDRFKTPGFRAVHRSNMSKLDDSGNPVRDGGGKIIKGKNYMKPELFRLFL